MWPFRRKSEEDNAARSEAALEDAERNLEEVKKRNPAVKEVSSALREFRNKNHISQQIEEIILVRRGQLR
jgi:hypothetical protein